MRVTQTKPNLGGWLTMLNCISWPVLISSLRTAESPMFEIGMTCLALLSLPLVWLLLLPSAGGGLTHFDIVMMSVLIGINSIVWGYGLASIVRRLSKCRTRQDVNADR